MNRLTAMIFFPTCAVTACFVLTVAQTSGMITPSVASSSVQRLDVQRLVKSAVIDYYRSGTIPRWAGGPWTANRHGFRRRLLQYTLPRQLERLRRHWAGPWLAATLTVDDFDNTLQSGIKCCVALRDLHILGVSLNGARLRVHYTTTLRLRQVVPGSFREAQRRPRVSWTPGIESDDEYIFFRRVTHSWMATALKEAPGQPLG